MSVLDLNARIQAGAQQLDLRKVFARLGRILLSLLVFVISVAPFSVAWAVTMVFKLMIVAAREGAASASGQLSGGD